MIEGDKAAVIVNPRSAHGRTGRRWPALRAAIESALPGAVFFTTEGPRHGTELTRQALRDGFNWIVSVGGDGTHFEVANGFFEDGQPLNPKAVMSILPHGTGSDLARTLGIPRNAWKALPYLHSGAVIQADLGRLTYTDAEGAEGTVYFQNTCRIGMGGEVVDRVNRSSKVLGGFFTFFLATVRALLHYRDKPMRIKVDRIEVEQAVKEVIVAKGQYDGGGMHVAPNARLDNGVFDVYIIGRVGVLDALTSLHKLYLGRLRERPDVVKYFRARHLSFTSTEEVKINTDGEMPGVLPARIDLLPGALRITAGPRVTGLR